LLGHPFSDFVHPDDRAAAVASVAQQTEMGQQLLRFESRYRHKDGSYRWLEWNSRPDARSHQLIAVARDITERKQAEEREELKSRELALALEDSRETNVRLNLVADSVMDGLLTVDSEGTILTFNPSAERMFGYQREEVIGRDAHCTLLANPPQEGYVAHFVRTGEDGIIDTRHETLGRRKDGSVFPIELAITMVSRRGERDFIATLRDITERKEQDEVQAHDKETLEGAVRQRTTELRDRSIELDEARLETLGKLALVAEYRDKQTFEHAHRVGNTAALLGELLGLSALEVLGIQQAAPLHDIGKLAVSDRVLLKHGRLTAKEWGLMRSHTTAGHAILSGSTSDVLSLAAEIALSHHEWWDGSGYPAGLKGERIPLSGRIVAVADVFDSLCHERSYKNAWTVEEAVAEIHRLSGTQFDPAVVDAFNQLDSHQLVGGSPTGPPAQVIRETSGNGRRSVASVAWSGSPNGKLTENVGIVGRSAGSKENEALLAPTEDRYRRLVERSYDMILSMDLAGIVTAANPGAERILGFSPEEIVGTNIIEYLAPGERERAGAMFKRIAAGTDFVSEEFEHVAKGGRRVFVEVLAYPIELDGQPVGLEGIGRDVTERRALQDTLSHQSLHDSLTGLPNRTLFFDRLGQALARAPRRSSTVAVMLFDLDDFKLINDSLGHGVGDEVLVAVARRLDRDLRRSQSVSRLGGDEFAFIVEDVKTEPELAAVASRILSAMAEPLAVDDRVVHVTTSLGIALAEPGDDPVSLLLKADIAMYQAKAEYGGDFGFYNPKLGGFPQPTDARLRPLSRR
jgi:diguanylate cyclase (GGDEF)-like protein/PAS domain S-box-containing protein